MSSITESFESSSLLMKKRYAWHMFAYSTLSLVFSRCWRADCVASLYWNLKKREKKGNFHDLGQPVDSCEEGRSVEGSAQTVHEAAFERVVVAAGDVIPIKKDPSIDMMRGKSPFTFWSIRKFGSMWRRMKRTIDSKSESFSWRSVLALTSWL